MKSVVSILRSTPETVLQDIPKLMRLANYRDFLPQDKKTALKINITWHFYYPACSSTPWQLEGVIKTLLEDGYKKEDIYACHNKRAILINYKVYASSYLISFYVAICVCPVRLYLSIS